MPQAPLLLALALALMRLLVPQQLLLSTAPLARHEPLHAMALTVATMLFLAMLEMMDAPTSCLLPSAPLQLVVVATLPLLPLA